MIEASEVISPAAPSKGELAAGDVRKLLLDLEHEAVEQRAAGGGKVGDKKHSQSLKEAPGPKDSKPLEDAEEIAGQHRRLWALVSKRLECGLKKQKPEEGLARLKVVKLAGDILSVVVKGQRQAWGLDAIEGGFNTGDTQEIIEEMASLTAPSRTDTAME